MPTNKEILESIKQLTEGLQATISDAENNTNSAFFKESIKLSVMQIFDKAQLLSDIKKTEFSKPVPEVKIIVQETAKPEINKEIMGFKTETPVAPVEAKVNIEVAPVKEVTPIKNEVIEKPMPEPAIEKPKEIVSKPQAVNIEDEEDTSLNAKIAKYSQPVINVADKLKDTPIKELVKAISISKKFEFINELFSGKAEIYKESLQTIENCDSYEAAAGFIEKNIAETHNWDENEPLAAEFFALVKRRFI